MANGMIKNPGWKLVWTNPNPSSSFSAQKVDLDLSDYDFVLIVARYGLSTIRYFMSISPIDGTDGTLLNMGNFANATGYLMVRTFSPASDGVTFDSSYRRALNSTSAAAASGDYCIPMYIYGVKL